MKKTAWAFSLLISSAVFAQERQLIQKWETDTLLKVPESVLYDANAKILYVSNIDGQPWEKDGKGSIGKVGLDGKIIAAEWVSGLQAPKGMGLYKGKLYVADVDRVVVIDVKKGAIDKTIEVQDAEALNDLSINDKGIVYVTDSKAKKLLRIEKGQPSVLLDNLNGPNGVLAQGNDLYILDAGGLYKVGKDKSLTKLADGMEGGTDGVEQVAPNEFIVSCWGGMMYYVNADGTTHNLLDTREQKMNTADIGYDAKNRIVYVPTFWKNKIVAYELK
jgi:hypothetical protein